MEATYAAPRHLTHADNPLDLGAKVRRSTGQLDTLARPLGSTSPSPKLPSGNPPMHVASTGGLHQVGDRGHCGMSFATHASIAALNVG